MALHCLHLLLAAFVVVAVDVEAVAFVIAVAVQHDVQRQVVTVVVVVGNCCWQSSQEDAALEDCHPCHVEPELWTWLVRSADVVVAVVVVVVVAVSAWPGPGEAVVLTEV